VSASPTTVRLRDLVPKLYELRDVTGMWLGLLQVLEDTINDLLAAQATRAILDGSKVSDGTFDTIVEAFSEGEPNPKIAIALVDDGTSPATCVTTFSPSPTVMLHYKSGTSTIADVEAAIASEVLGAGLDPLVRIRVPGTQARVLGHGATFGDPALTTVVYLSGESPTGHVLGKVSVDAQTDIFDPLAAEKRLLPYLSQKFGWELDPDLREQVQRKVLTLLRPLYAEKGTKQGIVDALRLLLGVDVDYHDLWGDGWNLGTSTLGGNTYLAPDQHADAYSRGSLSGADPGLFSDHDLLTCAAWSTAFEIQKTARSGGEAAIGFLTAVPRSVLANNLTIILPGAPQEFEFKVDAAFVAVAGRHVIDVSGPSNEDPNVVAAAIVAAITAEHGLGNVTVTATTPGTSPVVRLQQDATGSAGNLAIGGTALEVLSVHGLFGGASAGSFSPAGGKQAINLIGAAGAADVANRVADAIAYYATTVAVTRSLDNVLLRNKMKGTAGDGAITGAAAAMLAAKGMSGGIGINRAILTFRISVPRPLTTDELRLAQAMIEFAKRAETHYVLVSPPNPPLPGLFQLGFNHLGSAARLCLSGPADYQYPTGDVADDEFAWYIGRTWTVQLDDTQSVRSPRLIVGSRYLVEVDDESYVRQTNRVGVATSSDFPIPAYRRRPIIVGSLKQAYVAALRVAAGATAYLRVTRVEGGV
jgi:phage tail-like protein